MTAHNALGQPVEAYGWPNSLRESVRREQADRLARDQRWRDDNACVLCHQPDWDCQCSASDRLLEEHRVGYRKQDLHPVRPGEVIDALDGGLGL